MLQQINEEVGVVMYSSARQQASAPHLIRWQNKDYAVGEVGFHYTIWQGRTLHHIYELVDAERSLWMRLNLDTSNLRWTLEAVSDGLAD